MDLFSGQIMDAWLMKCLAPIKSHIFSVKNGDQFLAVWGPVTILELTWCLKTDPISYKYPLGLIMCKEGLFYSLSSLHNIQMSPLWEARQVMALGCIPGSICSCKELIISFVLANFWPFFSITYLSNQCIFESRVMPTLFLRYKKNFGGFE